MENFIENKVAKSGLITIDLIDFLAEKPIEVIDIANQLWQGLALKEQDFREFLKTNNWVGTNNTLYELGSLLRHGEEKRE